MPADDLYDDVEIIRYHEKDGLVEMDDPVVRESSVRLHLNDMEVVILQSLKNELKELALGFLYTECLINDIDAVKNIEISDGFDAVTVLTDENIAQSQTETVHSVTSGCGRGISFINPLRSNLFQEIDTAEKVSAKKILELTTGLLRLSQLFRTTGGVHTAALSDGAEIIHNSDDIGRHNCVDKIIGWELRNRRVEPGRRMILSSGRLSSDIVAKSVRGRIPVVVSHSAPTMGAVQLAEKFGITLIGFVRGKRFNVYTHKERVEL